MKIEIKDESHWHELRAKSIGGSEVAALYGRSSYQTPWQLWQTKAGNLNAPFDDTYTRAGHYFESAIAAWAADKWGMKIDKVREYYTDDTTQGMGASLDYATETGEPVEIKFNHYAGSDWVFENGELVDVPEQYIWQVQHQLACYGGDHGWLVAFAKGEPHRIRIRRSERIIDSIRQHVSDFWQSIADKEPPPVDLKEDGKALATMMFMRGVRDVDLSEHEALFEEYKVHSDTEKAAGILAKEAKTKIMSLYESAIKVVNEPVDKAVITAGKYQMVVNRVADSEGKLVTPAMVGTYVGSRKGHLRTQLKEVVK